MGWPPQTAIYPHAPPLPIRRPVHRGLRLIRVIVAASLVLLVNPFQGQAQAPKAPEYAGSEACATCHDEIAKAFGKNPHQRLESQREWKGRSCEACHGPGAKHAESVASADIQNPARLAPLESERACLRCHGIQPAQAGRLHQGHGRNQVACTSCHRVHKEPQQLALRAPRLVNRLCAGCHAAEWAEFQRPHAHRLSQGAMSCADCHDPHGSRRASSIREVAANEPACLRCHGDKRGPFPFEHAPVRLEGCQSCHVPHGTVNPRMLVRSEVRFLCLECHSNVGSRPASGGIPPAFHDLQSARYRNCTVCHTRIHGSFVERRLTR